MIVHSSTLGHASNTAANFAGGATVGGGGVLVFIGENATAIGAICVIATFLASVIFKTIYIIELRRHHMKIEKKYGQINHGS